jgi:hypothetical protein
MRKADPVLAAIALQEVEHGFKTAAVESLVDICAAASYIENSR